MKIYSNITKKLTLFLSLFWVLVSAVQAITFDQLPADQKTSINGIKFAFYSAGTVANMHCVQILETADPHTWTDNYMCTSQDIGMKWHSAGGIAGMNCTQISEPSDPHTWHDNFLCLPQNSGFKFNFSYAGAVGDYTVRWLESADPYTWNDNYLGIKATGTGVVSNVDGGGNRYCLGLTGAAGNGVAVTNVSCDSNAPVWTRREDGRIAYGDNSIVAPYCLDVDTANPFNYNKVNIWSCQGAPQNQTWKWDLQGNIALSYNNQCVAPGIQGQQLLITGCNSSQNWDLVKTRGVVANSFNGQTKCLGLLDPPGASSRVTPADCAGAPVWQLYSPHDAADGSYLGRVGYIGASSQSGQATYCLDVDTANPFNYNKVGMWNCAGSSSTNQLWEWQMNNSIKLWSNGVCIGDWGQIDASQQLLIQGCNVNNSWVMQ